MRARSISSEGREEGGGVEGGKREKKEARRRKIQEKTEGEKGECYF